MEEETALNLISAARQAFSGSQRKRKSGDKSSSAVKPEDIEAPTDKDGSL
jgi:hypothetical protein